MDFNLITILALGACLVIGAFIGVGLGRRSKTANSLYDRGRAELDEAQRRADDLEARLRIALNKLKDNGL
jgi:hypothetical protein